MTEADQWMSGAEDYRGRLTEKQHEGTFMGDGNVLNIDCGGVGYTGVHIFQNLQWVRFMVCSLSPPLHKKM